jgi:hypothetical protein
LFWTPVPPSPSDVLRKVPVPEDRSTTESDVIFVTRRLLTLNRLSTLMSVGFDTAISQRPSKQVPTSVAPVPTACPRRSPSAAYSWTTDPPLLRIRRPGRRSLRSR